MKEKIIFDKYLKPLEINGNGIHFEPIETGALNPGFPDLIYFRLGHAGVIELKVGKYIDKRKTVFLRFEPLQQVKLCTMAGFIKHVFVLLYAFDTFYLLKNYVQIAFTKEELEGVALWKNKTVDLTLLNYL